MNKIIDPNEASVLLNEVVVTDLNGQPKEKLEQVLKLINLNIKLLEDSLDILEAAEVSSTETKIYGMTRSELNDNLSNRMALKMMYDEYLSNGQTKGSSLTEKKVSSLTEKKVSSLTEKKVSPLTEKKVSPLMEKEIWTNTLESLMTEEEFNNYYNKDKWKNTITFEEYEKKINKNSTKLLKTSSKNFKETENDRSNATELKPPSSFPFSNHSSFDLLIDKIICNHEIIDVCWNGSEYFTCPSDRDRSKINAVNIIVKNVRDFSYQLIDKKDDSDIKILYYAPSPAVPEIRTLEIFCHENTKLYQLLLNIGILKKRDS